MKTIIMNQDIHQPAFIKADASYKTEKNRQPPSSVESTSKCKIIIFVIIYYYNLNKLGI